MILGLVIAMINERVKVLYYYLLNIVRLKATNTITGSHLHKGSLFSYITQLSLTKNNRYAFLIMTLSVTYNANMLCLKGLAVIEIAHCVHSESCPT